MRRMRLALVALMLGIATPAFALPSGGGMGGGGWGGGGGGAGGGASTDTGGQGVSMDARPLSAPVLVLFVLGSVAILGALALWSRPSPPRMRAGGASRDVRVAVLHVALDASARERVQSELRAIAKRAVTTTAEGRATMLHEAATVVRRLATASAYVGGSSDALATRMDARRRFREHVASARALLDGEVIEQRDGRSFDVSDVQRDRSQDDGFGLVLVTFVVAVRGDAFETLPIDRPSLKATLAEACNVLPHELVAVDIVWTPASGNDVMTAFALEARLGHALTKLDGVIEGTRVCAYCRSAYRAELVRCTHCGGQARAA